MVISRRVRAAVPGSHDPPTIVVPVPGTKAPHGANALHSGSLIDAALTFIFSLHFALTVKQKLITITDNETHTKQRIHGVG